MRPWIYPHEKALWLPNRFSPGCGCCAYCLCDHCDQGRIPRYFTVEFSGIVDDTCGDCADYDGAYLTELQGWSTSCRSHGANCQTIGFGTTHCAGSTQTTAVVTINNSGTNNWVSAYLSLWCLGGGGFTVHDLICFVGPVMDAAVDGKPDCLHLDDYELSYSPPGGPVTPNSSYGCHLCQGNSSAKAYVTAHHTV